MPLDANNHPFLIAQEVRVMKIRKFEDLESWKKARELTNAVHGATATGSFARDFGLKDQIRRASISILSNIAEGFERGGDREFLQFLAMAKGSCGEVRAQLYVAIRSRLSVATPLRKTIQRCRGDRPVDFRPDEVLK
jgi:four helix bundle protein